MTRPVWTIVVLLTLAGTASADLSKIERRITKEPAYQTKSPRYALLVFGPDAKDRVWLVKDGDTLYVDRNGDGDLTAADEKVSPAKGGSVERGYEYEIGTLKLGGKTHHNCDVAFTPLQAFHGEQVAKRNDVRAALKKEPTAEVMRVSLEGQLPHLRPRGRVTLFAGPVDSRGPLLSATRAADAPIVHLGGPLHIDFFFMMPTLRRGRTQELTLVAGTPGLGGGTFAVICYEDTIPADVTPVCDITFPPAKEGGEPVKQRYELKKRC